MKSPSQRAEPIRPSRYAAALQQTGLSTQTASRYQALANVPGPTFEEALREGPRGGQCDPSVIRLGGIWREPERGLRTPPAWDYRNLLYSSRMHVITRRRLVEFWIRHPPAKGPMAAWHTVIESAEFNDFASVRDTFNSADLVKGHVVFNVNSYRIVADIRYAWGKVFIVEVMTHADYERWSQKMRKGK